MESRFLNYITGETLKSNSEATNTDKAAAAPKSKVVAIIVVLRILCAEPVRLKGMPGQKIARQKYLSTHQYFNVYRFTSLK